jgi:hypothetical protein
MDMVKQIQKSMDDDNGEEIIRLCVGPESELSKEVVKNTKVKPQCFREKMSFLRREIITCGKGGKKTKDLKNIEHVDLVKNG